MNTKTIHFSIITILSLVGLLPLSSGAANTSCVGYYSPPTITSPRAALLNYFQSANFKGFLFDKDAKTSSQAVIQIVARAQSGTDFVTALKAVLAVKSNWYLGGIADRNFDDLILPGLLEKSKNYTLTSAERTEISDALQDYTLAKHGSKKALNYKNSIWGHNEFVTKLSKYISSKEFKGFLLSEASMASANDFIDIVSEAKSSGDFVDAVAAVLAIKSNRYMGGLADKKFNDLMLPKLLATSRLYDLSSQDKNEIKALLKSYADSPMGSKTALLYKNLVWGKDDVTAQIEKYLSSPEYKGFLFPESAKKSAEYILAIVDKASNSDDFITAVKAVLGIKANIYMGGLADNNFHALIFPGLLKISRKFEFNSQEQAELALSLREYAKAPFGSKDAFDLSHEYWGN